MTEPTELVVPETGELVPINEQPADIKPEKYVTGFDGMAVQPFPEAAAKALVAPLDPGAIEVKPDGIVYLPGVFYRQRLTEAFGPGGWALAPRGPARIDGELVMYHGALYCLGRFVSEAIGECRYRAGNENMSYASALEGARTDCLTRCCKDLLVAKEMWDPTWRETWLAEHAVKAWNKQARSGKGSWHYWRKDRETPWQVGEKTVGVPARAAQPKTHKEDLPPPVVPESAKGEAALDAYLDRRNDLTRRATIAIREAIAQREDWQGIWTRLGAPTPKAVTEQTIDLFEMAVLACEELAHIGDPLPVGEPDPLHQDAL